ncbi:CrcB family protein [Saccharomonospora sp. NPDC006951]
MKRGAHGDVLLVVALGGGLGSLARYGLAEAMPHPEGGFAASTLLTNIGGCLLIGALMVIITDSARPHRLLRPFLGIGILGGFTTFSTYVVDAIESVLAGNAGIAIAYAVASVVASLVAVVAGMLLTRTVMHGFGKRRRSEVSRKPENQHGGV